MSAGWEVVIGLEIHTQLATNSMTTAPIGLSQPVSRAIGDPKTAIREAIASTVTEARRSRRSTTPRLKAAAKCFLFPWILPIQTPWRQPSPERAMNLAG